MRCLDLGRFTCRLARLLLTNPLAFGRGPRRALQPARSSGQGNFGYRSALGVYAGLFVLQTYAMTARTLLAHVVSKFTPRQWENVATESLRYLLTRPGGATAVEELLSPLGFQPGPLTWHGQVTSADDSAIPDLVGNDPTGRHVLVMEGKFWAALTANQPEAYLLRQVEQFPDTPDAHLLLFLVPERRRPLITAELESRLGVKSRPVGRFALLEPDQGSVAVVTWEHMLGHLKSALEADHDVQALEDLNQLWGLCDRADAVAMLPLADEEVASYRGQRHYEFCDVVDRVVDQLVPETLSTKKLKAVGGKDYYGRWVRAGSGHEMQIAVLSLSWAYRYPTPWWIRFWRPAADLEKAVRTLTDDLRFPLIEVDGDWLRVAMRPPLGRERDAVVAELASATHDLARVLPSLTQPDETDPTTDSLTDTDMAIDEV